VAGNLDLFREGKGRALGFRRGLLLMHNLVSPQRH
jgi:hypothetical protein